MKHSEFAGAVEATFGSYGASVRADLVLSALGGRTPDEALADGAAPQRVWDAMCDALDLGEAQRFPHRRGHRRA
ncbi:DUF3046 domain-containing protein [Pseudactinotalea sp. HY158]|uniref:DUF3046 domain-containing protein n=1 Tax=unclassified Pseudactinotalea TaxID=2649176 RepID=UPI00129CD538|nr:DUF3046 domain-containing protein [Pseudactinotalea sp. HY158]MPV49556.1 DUF3046 domain-containing protein [Pseudactinotalea sp. HY160]QGH69858.1 DUF3046 domain-containing protein [Pseudactinotalea sp. HY158]